MQSLMYMYVAIFDGIPLCSLFQILVGEKGALCFVSAGAIFPINCQRWIQRSLRLSLGLSIGDQVSPLLLLPKYCNLNWEWIFSRIPSRPSVIFCIQAALYIWVFQMSDGLCWNTIQACLAIVLGYCSDDALTCPSYYCDQLECALNNHNLKSWK